MIWKYGRNPDPNIARANWVATILFVLSLFISIIALCWLIWFLTLEGIFRIEPAGAKTIDLTDYSSIDWTKYGKEAVVTMYSPRETCSGKCINARGKSPETHRSIACPRKLPFGTRVIINDEKYTCDDRTNKRFDGRFDIFTDSYEEALSWGKRRVIVTILP